MRALAVVCYCDPIRLPLGRLSLPGVTGYRQASLPVTRRGGAEEDLPISENNHLTVPSPLRRRVHQCPLPVPRHLPWPSPPHQQLGTLLARLSAGIKMTTFVRPRNITHATDRSVVPPRFAPGLSATHGGVPTQDPDISWNQTYPGWLSSVRSVLSCHLDTLLLPWVPELMGTRCGSPGVTSGAR